MGADERDRDRDRWIERASEGERENIDKLRDRCRDIWIEIE